MPAESDTKRSDFRGLMVIAVLAYFIGLPAFGLLTGW